MFCSVPPLCVIMPPKGNNFGWHQRIFVFVLKHTVNVQAETFCLGVFIFSTYHIAFHSVWETHCTMHTNFFVSTLSHRTKKKPKYSIYGHCHLSLVMSPRAMVCIAVELSYPAYYSTVYTCPTGEL